jgi:hypothetical protein
VLDALLDALADLRRMLFEAARIEVSEPAPGPRPVGPT